ncbi:hypothetical protein LCGC14_0560190 [marine sediment metagenome]|uniref:Uncharacterized protein n=1 Tax=marine sediment metagenome TaxID=412755 RepID=A0A0F9S5Y2_9ZZZZ
MENKRGIIKEYKTLIILMLFSVMVGFGILLFYLMEQNSIILFSLGFGLAVELSFLYMMVVSLKSKDKWSIVIKFNDVHEGIFEIFFIIILIVIGVISIIIYFIN